MAQTNPNALLSRNVNRTANALTIATISRGAPNGMRLLLAEDDPRFRQVVGGKLDFDFVARDDADEVLAHLA